MKVIPEWTISSRHKHSRASDVRRMPYLDTRASYWQLSRIFMAHLGSAYNVRRTHVNVYFK